jgi:hypothetical protein
LPVGGQPFRGCLAVATKKQKKQMGLEEALRLLGQQEGIAPERIKPVPPEPQEPAPKPAEPVGLDAVIHKEIPAGLRGIERETGAISDFLTNLFLGGQAPHEQPQPATPKAAAPFPTGPISDSMKAELESLRASRRKGGEPHPEVMLSGAKQRELEGLRASTRSKALMAQERPGVNTAGVREPDKAEPATKTDALGRTPLPDLSPEELGAIIQRPAGADLTPEAVETAAQPPSGAGGDFLQDRELEALARKASDYKKPGLLEALAVIGSGLNPRQSPQGTMALANQLRGEPERRNAQGALDKLVRDRASSRAFNAKSENEALKQGQLGDIERMKEQGRMGRAELGAKTKLGVAQIGAASRSKQGALTPGQESNRVRNFLSPRLNLAIGDLRARIGEAARSLDPAVREQLPAMQQELNRLNSMKIEALKMAAQQGLLSEESAAMLMLGEGVEGEGMDPDFTEQMRKYASQLPK